MYSTAPADWAIITEIRFHTINKLLIAVLSIIRSMFTSHSVDEILLPRYVNWSSNFRDLSLKVDMAPFHLKLDEQDMWETAEEVKVRSKVRS